LRRAKGWVDGGLWVLVLVGNGKVDWRGRIGEEEDDDAEEGEEDSFGWWWCCC
jgi:hypothetical protein